MSIAVNLDGHRCEIPEKFRKEYNEGKNARELRMCGVKGNPYAADYSRTGSTEDLWRAVAWVQGWKGSIR